MLSATIAVLGSRPLVRRGLEALLRTVGSYDVAPGYSCIKELHARDDLLDAVVLDLDRTMIDDLMEVGSLPVERVVGVHDHDEAPLARRCVALGVGALVLLAAEPAALLQAVERQLTDAAPMVVALPPRPRPQPSLLTERETEVLQLIADGLTTKDVSGRLGISPKTVENYKQHMFSKLGVQSRAHAVAVGSRMGLLGAPTRAVAFAGVPVA
jgi:DNA-binding NarL/FixJ family response regulator